MTGLRCAACRKALEASWNLCPFCGVRAPTRAILPSSGAKATWAAWRLYDRHLGLGIFPYVQEVATAVETENLAALAEVCRPNRFIMALSKTMRGLVGVAAQPDLPPPFRKALAQFALHERHEVKITERLTPAAAEINAAIQALIDAGEIDPGFLDAVSQYIEQRDQAGSVAQVASALTGADPGLARIVVFVAIRWLGNSRSDARKQRLGEAWLGMFMVGSELVDEAWDTLVRKCSDAGLVLREAADLREVETQAQGYIDQLTAQQRETDGSFEQTLSLAHALARQHPDAPPVLNLVTRGDLLAEVRAQLLGSWLTRVAIGMDQDAQTRARQEFLRLLPGDAVIAFFSTSIFGQGKAGLVLTTASVQWLTDTEPRRVGYAQLRPERVNWSGKLLKIGDHEVELYSEADAEAAGRMLQSCVRLLIARPGPPECYCGAPMHWFVFGPNAAVCPGCRAIVAYW